LVELDRVVDALGCGSGEGGHAHLQWWTIVYTP
jgi:hypothetical protein